MKNNKQHLYLWLHTWQNQVGWINHDRKGSNTISSQVTGWKKFKYIGLLFFSYLPSNCSKSDYISFCFMFGPDFFHRLFSTLLRFLIALFLIESRTIRFLHLTVRLSRSLIFLLNDQFWTHSSMVLLHHYQSDMALFFFPLRSHVSFLLSFFHFFSGVHPQVIFLSKIMWKGNVLSICMPECDIILHYAFSHSSPKFSSTLWFPSLPSNNLLITKHNGHF